MKVFIKTLLSTVLFLCCTGQISAQPNEATIFVLEDKNLSELVVEITNFIGQSGGIPPSSLVLSEFLSKVYDNRVYRYNPNACPIPATRVFEQGGAISFEFDNFGSGYPDALFVSKLEMGGQQKSSSAVHGPEGYNGLTFPINEVQQHIFLIGSFCSLCQSAFNHCASKWEIIIIDKNIL